MIHYMTSNGLGNAWVGNELRAVLKEGIPVAVHALNRPAKTFFTAPEMARLDRETRGLYPVRRFRFAQSVLLAPLLFRERSLLAAWNALTGERESLTIRAKGIWHLLVACDWARGLRDRPPALIHSQWIHSGGTVAMYGAWLLGVPFSFTGHAADLFRERAALRDKIKRADFIVCISEFHREFFLREGARPEQLIIAYCGIDPSHFAPRQGPRPDAVRPRILSSGRLVEKKGFSYLIEACDILRARGLDFECVIAGNGPLEESLRALVKERKLEDRITITGEALMQEKLPEFMRSGDVYCLACVWASDNDVDGLPQMLMEAMACGLPVVSTRLVGIPDLVIDGETGLLAKPNDAAGLADALQRMIEDPALAQRLAAAGRKYVVEKFDLATCLNSLTERFKGALGGA